MSALQPLWRCEIAFTSNPLDASPVWAEVVSAAGVPLIKAYSSHRGRQHVLNSVEPGTATFTFVGTGQELDPTNTGSPYYPNVDINKPIRIGVMLNSLTAAQAAITAGWTAGANTTVGFASNVLTLTAVAAGNVSASTASGTSGFRVLPSHPYWAQLTMNTTSASTATLTITWYDASGATISTTTAISQAEGGTTGPSVTSPSGAAYASFTYAVAAVGAGSTHQITHAGLMDRGLLPSGPAWRPGGMLQRFTGYIDSIKPSWQDNILNEVAVTATDVLRLLQQTQLPADPFVTLAVADGATALWPFDDPAGSTTAREVVSGRSALPSVVLPTFGQAARIPSVSSTTMLIADTGVSALTVPVAAIPSGTGAFSIECWFKCTTADYIYVHGPSAYLFEVGAGVGNMSGGAKFEVIGTSVSLNGTTSVIDGNWHHVVATRDGLGGYFLYVDGSLQASTTGQANPSVTTTTASWSLGAGTAKTLSGGAIYSGMALNSTQVAKHYQIGAHYFATPAKSGTRMVDALTTAAIPSALYAAPGSGSDPGQSYLAAPANPPSTVKTYLDAIAMAERGMILARADGVVVLQDRAHQLNITPSVTFGDGTVGGEIPYRTSPDFGLDNVDLYNASTVTIEGGTPQTWAPGTNVTKYGVQNSLDESGLISAGGDAEALARAQYNVSQFATPQPRWRSLTCDVLPNLGTLGQDLIGYPGPGVAVEIGQQVTVNRRPPLTTSVAMVEGIDETVDLDHWTVTLHVSPADTQQYWVLGTSQLGVNTRLFW